MLPPPLITYDIVCGYKVNIVKRFAAEFPEFREVVERATYCIPEMHICGHGCGCQDEHTIGHKPGTGRTHGEGVEHLWPHTNAMAASTREMNHGARQDKVIQFLSYWNFSKFRNMRKSLFIRSFKYFAYYPCFQLIIWPNAWMNAFLSLQRRSRTL